MRITKLSDNFTPLNEGILFEIDSENETPTDIIVEIVEVATGEVVGTQLLRNTTSTTINIAPYMTRLDGYAPTSPDHTTFIEAPTASYRVRVDSIESAEVVVSVNRCRMDSKPSIATSLPSRRRIARGESDELLIVAESRQSLYAEITADTGESLHIEHLTLSGASTLAISTNDFETEINSLDITLYCEGKEFGSLHYAITKPIKTATRVAWLSECGAIERYSFPSAHRVKCCADKQTIVTKKGVVAAQSRVKRTISLCSRIEPRATIEGLSQLVSSPKVWVEQSGDWHLVEVITPQIEKNFLGEPSFLHLDICLWEKEVSL